MTRRGRALGKYTSSTGHILGILSNDPASFLQSGGDDDEVAKIEALIAQRNAARANKDWAAADCS